MIYLTLNKQASVHCIVNIVSKTIMWIVLFFVSCTSFLVNGYGNDEILGKGRWLVLNVLECEDPEKYEVPLTITRKKISRTSDAFSLHVVLDREVDATYGIEIIANKEVDGGYKFYQQLTDESFCGMAKKYIGNNWEDILTNANIDPPDCPIPMGDLIIDDYVVDYSQLEESGIYGKYDTSVYVTFMGSRLACMRLLVQFEKKHEGGDDGDGDDDDDDGDDD